MNLHFEFSFMSSYYFNMHLYGVASFGNDLNFMYHTIVAATSVQGMVSIYS